mmetsp:Transcript_26210/g.39622  ORF Transcript_26210/g.39622 Transcript_26210/m.39622 type:complete len:94 (-) Transcript_26210:32-313(-)
MHYLTLRNTFQKSDVSLFIWQKSISSSTTKYMNDTTHSEEEETTGIVHRHRTEVEKKKHGSSKACLNDEAGRKGFQNQKRKLRSSSFTSAFVL